MTNTTCPLTVPEGCPDYVAASVQNQCDRFLARALEGESSEEDPHRRLA